MFLQGAAIWHPRCGPGPDESMTASVNLNGGTVSQKNFFQKCAIKGVRQYFEICQILREKSFLIDTYRLGGGICA